MKIIRFIEDLDIIEILRHLDIWDRNLDPPEAEPEHISDIILGLFNSCNLKQYGVNLHFY